MQHWSPVTCIYGPEHPFYTVNCGKEFSIEYESCVLPLVPLLFWAECPHCHNSSYYFSSPHDSHKEMCEGLEKSSNFKVYKFIAEVISRS